MSTENVDAAPPATPALPEPLFLPKGSIRALVGIAMGVFCWVKVFTRAEVPSALLSLGLTVLGYYFGFRSGEEDPAVHPPVPAARQPLCLPTGVIRILLSVGFLASGVFLWITGKVDPDLVEFFVILFGLIVGYLFAKLTRGRKASRALRMVHHVKGALVLTATVCLGCVFFIGPHGEPGRILVTAMCAAVSFYFGSRS